MIDRLFEFFRDRVSEESVAETRDEAAIVLAAAALMLEVARADASKQSVELDTIARILGKEFEVHPDQIQELIAAAAEKVESATDLYQFTQLINDAFDYQEKLQLVHAMWRVAFADGHIEAIEDHIIRRVAGLLHVPNRDFVRVKISARDDSS